MGRKIRTGALLILVLVMIYTQQAVIYAQNEAEKNMKKTMIVEGMSCGHCSARVEQALNAIDGVTAKVDLEAKTASIVLSKPVEDQALVKAVADAGYQVVGI